MLDAIVEGLQPEATGVVEWAGNRMAIASYLHDRLPPEALVTSVRGVLIRDDRIVVMHNPDGSHPVPGGRREPGETLVETLRREVMEEAGCVIAEPVLLGFIHFRHLTPRPAGYPYPYPDFCQVVFAARVTEVRELEVPDEWEQRVEFVPLDQAVHLPFDEGHRVFVDAGVRALESGA